MKAADELGALRLRVDIAPRRQGALSGLTFAVKDMFDVAGIVTGGGSPDWLASHGPAARTAPSVQALPRCRRAPYRHRDRGRARVQPVRRERALRHAAQSQSP